MQTSMSKIRGIHLKTPFLLQNIPAESFDRFVSHRISSRYALLREQTKYSSANYFSLTEGALR